MWDYWAKAAEKVYDDATGTIYEAAGTVYGDVSDGVSDQREFLQGEVSKTTSQIGTLTDKGADTATDNTPAGLLDKVKDNAMVGAVVTGLVVAGGIAWRVFG